MQPASHLGSNDRRASIQDLMSIPAASRWASDHLCKNVTPSNISYLIQYGRIRKLEHNGAAVVSKQELADYYCTYTQQRKASWQGHDANWTLSFADVKEAETTKHVHRLHPYKGKFIPQLVEYFLDGHTDKFKRQVYFQQGDIILDPFCGSGTTLVQANELGMPAIGIDISAFNTLISNVKVSTHNLHKIAKIVAMLSDKLQHHVIASGIPAFEVHLAQELAQFNARHFPSPEFKYQVRQGEIDEKTYGPAQAQKFLPCYRKLLAGHKIKLLQANGNKNFLTKWYLRPVRREINLLTKHIADINDADSRAVIALMLSRTMRSCRATTHADLATLKEPMTTTYYCAKHGKVCRPLFSLFSWWQRYSKDTLQRLEQFAELRTAQPQLCLTGDARHLDILAALKNKHPQLAALVKKQKVRGIFSSPPYVGLIDYHEQHAYAYDLLGLPRRDAQEIGPLHKGKSKQAQADYVDGIAAVLRNCRPVLSDDSDIFLVANDSLNFYEQIASQAQMQIVNRFKRPVLNRTEKDRAAYSEVIFHLRQL